jgi:hypothetical protein
MNSPRDWNDMLPEIEPLTDGVAAVLERAARLDALRAEAATEAKVSRTVTVAALVLLGAIAGVLLSGLALGPLLSLRVTLSYAAECLRGAAASSHVAGVVWCAVGVATAWLLSQGLAARWHRRT